MYFYLYFKIKKIDFKKAHIISFALVACWCLLATTALAKLIRAILIFFSNTGEL